MSTLGIETIGVSRTLGTNKVVECKQLFDADAEIKWKDAMLILNGRMPTGDVPPGFAGGSILIQMRIISVQFINIELFARNRKNLASAA